MADPTSEQKPVEAAESLQSAPQGEEMAVDPTPEQKPAEAAETEQSTPQAEEKVAETTEPVQRETRSSKGAASKEKTKSDPDEKAHPFYKSPEWKDRKKEMTTLISDHDQIRQQVEFYFSAFNLPKDDHMKDLTDYPNNRPVPIKEITKFGRMRVYGPFSEVVAALKDSDLLEVIDGVSPEVKRKVPLEAMKVTEEEKAMSDSRFWGLYERQCSIYVKGFFPQQDVQQKDLEKVFNPYGATAVRMRRTGKDFKGSAFVSFASKEARDAFLARPDKPVWYDNKMTYMGKEEYCEEKLAQLDPPIAPEDEKFPEYEYGHYKKLKEREARNGRGQSSGRYRARGSRGSGRGRGRGRGRAREDREDREIDFDPKNFRERKERERNARKEEEAAKAPKPAAVDKDGVPVIATASKKGSIGELPDAPESAKVEKGGSAPNGNKKRERDDDVDELNGAVAEKKVKHQEQTGPVK